MNQENKPTKNKPVETKSTEAPNLFAAPTAGHAEAGSSGHSQTGVFVRSLLIVPFTLLAFFGPIYGFAWLRENEFWAFNSIFAMLTAIVLALLVFAIMLIDTLRVWRRSRKPETMVNHEFPD